jgi:hypothetical protein
VLPALLPAPKEVPDENPNPLPLVTEVWLVKFGVGPLRVLNGMKPWPSTPRSLRMPRCGGSEARSLR